MSNPLPVLKWVGCYSQRARDLAKWKARGVNFAMHWEREDGKVTQPQWRQAARDAGLFYVDTWLSDDDTNDPSLIGWIIKDSDEWNRVRGNPPVRPDVAPLVAEAQRLAALNAATGSSRLILANADGFAVTAALMQNPPYNGIGNGEKALMPLLTGRSFDSYPVVQTASTAPDQIARRPMYLPAQAAWRMRTWNQKWGSQPALYCAIVEAAKDAHKPLGVTPDQMREQVEYLCGLRPFPVPDNQGKPLSFQGQVADMLVWWTANGGFGAGWDWFACTPDQEIELISITRELLGTAVASPPPPITPDPGPPPVIVIDPPPPVVTPPPVPTPVPLTELVARLEEGLAAIARAEARVNEAVTHVDGVASDVERRLAAAGAAMGGTK